MSGGERNSALNSGPTSPDVQQKLNPETELSEAEFLQRQADQAKAAILRACQDIAAGLEQGVDPRAWTKDYPLAAITTAAAAGFIAAITLVPSKEEQALRKLAALERAMNPPPPVPPAVSGAAPGPRGGALVGLFGQLVKTLGPAVSSAITAAIAARNAATDTNGHPEPPPQPPAQSDPDSGTE